MWGTDNVIPGDAIAGFARFYMGSGATHSERSESCVLDTQVAIALTTPFGRCQWHPHPSAGDSSSMSRLSFTVANSSASGGASFSVDISGQTAASRAFNSK